MGNINKALYRRQVFAFCMLNVDRPKSGGQKRNGVQRQALVENLGMKSPEAEVLWLSASFCVYVLYFAFFVLFVLCSYCIIVFKCAFVT